MVLTYELLTSYAVQDCYFIKSFAAYRTGVCLGNPGLETVVVQGVAACLNDSDVLAVESGIRNYSGGRACGCGYLRSS